MNELDPILLYVVEDQRARFAVWRLERDQRQALALFSNEAAANVYRHRHLTPEWQVYKPSRPQLLTILRASVDDGIDVAVVDPGPQGVQTLFDLPHVLTQGVLPE